VTSAGIKARAAELGFDLCGIAPVGDHRELSFFREWLARGYGGQMQYLERSDDRRADVRAVLASAQSVICLGTVYNSDRPPSTKRPPGQARIARYAWGDDYHDVIGRRMDALLDWMRERAEPFEARAYVDTGPVQEKLYAQYAGLGWIGKNTCVINPTLGSWIFLSEIICSLPLAPDAPAIDQCGVCRRCLHACPTGALVEPYVLDATRCLSYLTIELKGPIPDEWREAVGAHAYGCDICQDVCPWNKSAAVSDDPAWLPRAIFDGRSLAELWATPDAELRRGLKGSAMTRAGVKRLRRNLATCAGATGDADALTALAEVREPSCEEPLVTEHIDWARAVAPRKWPPYHACSSAPQKGTPYGKATGA
jgi:epoxyqueuosine reductase